MAGALTMLGVPGANGPPRAAGVPGAVAVAGLPGVAAPVFSLAESVGAGMGVIAEVDAGGVSGRRRYGCGADTLLRGRAQVVTAHASVLRFAIDGGPIGGVLPGVETVAAGDGVPVCIDGAAGGAEGAGAAPGVVVLQAAADEIGAAHVGGDLVELAGFDGVVIVPGVAAIVTDVEAAVMAYGDDPRIFWIDPEGVVIGVGAGEAFPGFTAIERHLRGGAADEEFLIVDGVDMDLAEVGGALVLIAEEGPGFAAIVGAEDAAAVRVGGRGCGGSRDARGCRGCAELWLRLLCLRGFRHAGPPAGPDDSL